MGFDGRAAAIPLTCRSLNKPEEAMSDTDIYKNREAMPIGGKSPKKKRHRRSASRRAFDEDHNRKRRSKNSGFRRLLHLTRKSDNEKYFWGSIGITIVVVLVLIAIWQFWVAEVLVRSEESKNDYMEYQPHIPQTTDSSERAGE
jgi:hypothetical protein